MINYELYCRIKQAEAAGHSAPQIARSLQLHVQTVRRWQAQEKYARSQAAQVPRPSKLDVHKPAIARWLEAHPFTAMQLWQKVRERGYTGGYSILKDYVRRVRPRNLEAFLTLKFAPGQTAQVDWGSFGSVEVDGTR
ncbi:MAG: transposase, partial [Opitutus sp.]|nr:transposase [Opitutus sp.]